MCPGLHCCPQQTPSPRTYITVRCARTNVSSHHIHYSNYFFDWESDMRFLIRQWTHRNAGVLLAGVAFLLSASMGVSCGGSTQMQTLNMGTVNVSMSDPPSCMAPNGSSTSFTHVFITVRSVQAHIDPRADDNSSNWQELAPQLATICLPRQRTACWRNWDRQACRWGAINKSGCCWFPIIQPRAQRRQQKRTMRAPETVSTAWCSATTPYTSCSSAARTTPD